MEFILLPIELRELSKGIFQLKKLFVAELNSAQQRCTAVSAARENEILIANEREQRKASRAEAYNNERFLHRPKTDPTHINPLLFPTPQTLLLLLVCDKYLADFFFIFFHSKIIFCAHERKAREIHKDSRFSIFIN